MDKKFNFCRQRAFISAPRLLGRLHLVLSGRIDSRVDLGASQAILSSPVVPRFPQHHQFYEILSVSLGFRTGFILLLKYGICRDIFNFVPSVSLPGGLGEEEKRDPGTK